MRTSSKFGREIQLGREFVELLEQLASRKRLITERNQYFIVEVIRNVAEYCVFGERVGKSHMEVFMESNCFSLFQSILSQNCKLVNMQMIQTTSILLQNLKSQACQSKLSQASNQGADYILSHPFI